MRNEETTFFTLERLFLKEEPLHEDPIEETCEEPLIEDIVKDSHVFMEVFIIIDLVVSSIDEPKQDGRGDRKPKPQPMKTLTPKRWMVVTSVRDFFALCQ